MTTQSKGAIGRAAMWSIVNQCAGQILALVVFLITARFVSKEAFGVMAICLLVIEAFRQLISESVATAITAKNTPSDEDYNASFLIIAGGGLVSAIIVFLFANFIARLLHHAEIAGTLRWVSLLFLTLGLSRTHGAWLAKNLMFKALTLRSLVSTCVGGIVGIVMAVKGFGLMALVVQQIVGELVSTVCLWLTTDWRPSLNTSWAHISSLLHYSRKVSMTSAAYFADSQSDVFFSSYYLGAAPTGIYNAAKRIITALNMMLSKGLNSVALPTLANFAQDENRVAPFFLKGVSMTSLMTAPLYAGLAALAPDIVHVLMGSRWADVAPILSILAVNGFFASLLQYNGNIILVKDRPQWQFYLALINAAANIIVFVAVGRLGLAALAIAYVTKTIVLFPLSVGAALTLIKVRPRIYLAHILPSCVAALVMALLVALIREQLPMLPSYASIVLLVPVGALIYFSIMAVLGRKTLIQLYSIVQHSLRKT